ncbi:MAG: hypothetical protein R3F13_21470 [Prosthecobacter sp.]
MRRLQDTPKLGDLAVNPLLLTMICMVHRYHGALPGSRSQLYDEICQVLLERWRQHRNIKDKYSSNQKLEALRPLAVWMMEHHTKDLGEEEMFAVIEEPLARIGVAAGRDAARDFVLHLRDSSGIWLEKELSVWGFAHLSFQEHLCAQAWAISEKARPNDWSPLLTHSWWRETLLLYAVKSSDATSLAESALNSGSEGKAFALQLLDERINLSSATRARMENVLLYALESQDRSVFLPAAEAWLIRQQAHHYTRLDDEREISGWVTQGEYQTYLLHLEERHRADFTPLHWNKLWFTGGCRDPIVGMTEVHAEFYCEWLNKRFPVWLHRLPRSDSELVEVSPTLNPIFAWVGSESTVWRIQTPPARSSILSDSLGIPSSIASHSLQVLLEARSVDVISTNKYETLSHDKLELAREVARDLTRYLSFESDLKNPEHTIGCALEIALEQSGKVGTKAAVEAFRSVFRQTLQPNVKTLRKERCNFINKSADNCVREFRSLSQSNAGIFIYRTSFRRFWLACFDAFYRHNVRLMTPQLLAIDSALRILIAREEGLVHAWEGLRIVRERRK